MHEGGNLIVCAIRRWLRRSGKKLSQVARESGVNYHTIHTWLMRNYIPSTEDLARVVEAFGFPAWSAAVLHSLALYENMLRANFEVAVRILQKDLTRTGNGLRLAAELGVDAGVLENALEKGQYHPEIIIALLERSEFNPTFAFRLLGYLQEGEEIEKTLGPVPDSAKRPPRRAP